MTRFLPDTSCIIAALCAWHEHHARAARAIDDRLAGGDVLVAAAPALVEVYAVLTRLPPPHRLAPADAWALLAANFRDAAIEVVALTPTAYWSLLEGAPQRGITGGHLYDAVIAACALTARVDALLTFNESHFRPLVAPEIDIVVP